MKTKRGRTGLSLLVLLVSLPLLIPMGGKVLCFSPENGHISVELPHTKTEHTRDTVPGEALSFSDVCEHSDCTDIPLAGSDIVLLAKVDHSVKAVDFSILKYETAKIVFDSIDGARSLVKSELARVAKLSTIGAHFLYILVRTIVFLN